MKFSKVHCKDLSKHLFVILQKYLIWVVSYIFVVDVKDAQLGMFARTFSYTIQGVQKLPPSASPCFWMAQICQMRIRKFLRVIFSPCWMFSLRPSNRGWWGRGTLIHPYPVPPHFEGRKNVKKTNVALRIFLQNPFQNGDLKRECTLMRNTTSFEFGIRRL